MSDNVMCTACMPVVALRPILNSDPIWIWLNPVAIKYFTMRPGGIWTSGSVGSDRIASDRYKLLSRWQAVDRFAKLLVLFHRLTCRSNTWQLHDNHIIMPALHNRSVNLSASRYHSMSSISLVRLGWSKFQRVWYIRHKHAATNAYRLWMYRPVSKSELERMNEWSRPNLFSPNLSGWMKFF